MNRYVKYALLGGVCLFVSETQAAPIDATLLKKIADGFQCRVSDFIALEAILATGDKKDEREAIFRVVDQLNSQIVKHCKASVLRECGVENTTNRSEIYGFGHHSDLTGPINNLGINTGFVEGYTRANDFPRSYETTVYHKLLHSTVACFAKQID